ncbi:uncharacterized protein EV422DRAFT_130419 [Fimicolochytrium jonesii]|uniref:uncharacterized protein n=1 Tax=Fimicolochytrium jonesii TaxID=1396493 RepID=UPI0022FE373F|nr:uncharacterized protein EV422DRAFT_130419 [Fimicolochytrium jonesii]KAI8819026.1 hypothetical protein EV422DRAFT_130419 [Fimicolochytrium jonesii]
MRNRLLQRSSSHCILSRISGGAEGVLRMLPRSIFAGAALKLDMTPKVAFRHRLSQLRQNMTARYRTLPQDILYRSCRLCRLGQKEGPQLFDFDARSSRGNRQGARRGKVLLREMRSVTATAIALPCKMAWRPPRSSSQEDEYIPAQTGFGCCRDCRKVVGGICRGSCHAKFDTMRESMLRVRGRRGYISHTVRSRSCAATTPPTLFPPLLFSTLLLGTAKPHTPN